MTDDQIEKLRSENNYVACRRLPDDSVACVIPLLYTRRALILGVTEESFHSRFCFMDKELALQRYSELQTEDDIPEGHIATRSYRR